jgi:IclR family transcriptional regulator, mhp operon transcriptional activator
MIERNKSVRGAESVRSLERGINLIRVMNEDPHASVAVLSRQIKVPRSTIYRLLETLRSMGYVRLRRGGAGYRLTREVCRLSDGFPDEDWLNASWHELVKLGNELFWPLSLFTLDAGMMAIRRTTHERSRMSVDHGMRGRRMPMTSTAAGRAYLGFCPVREREWLLSLPEIADSLSSVAEKKKFDRLLEKVHKDGYGLRVGGLMPKTASISVPVMQDSKVLCCISVVWINNAIPLERAIKELAPPLKQAALRIEAIARA